MIYSSNAVKKNWTNNFTQSFYHIVMIIVIRRNDKTQQRKKRSSLILIVRKFFTMKKLLSLLVLLAATSAAFAHPGHGSTGGYTITHYITEPVHALPLLFAIVLGIVLIRREKRSTMNE